MSSAKHEHDAQMLRAVVGGVTHDLNNLLGVILGEASLLREPQLQIDTTTSASAILEASRRATDVVSQLAGYCGFRDTADQLECDLADVVGGMAHLLELIVGARGRIRFELLTGPAIVAGNLSLIRETLIDLANAAVSGSARAELVVRTGSHSVFEVDDIADTVRHGTLAEGRRSFVELVGDHLEITPELDEWLGGLVEVLDCVVTFEPQIEGHCIRLSLPFPGLSGGHDDVRNLTGTPVLLVDHDSEVRRVTQALLQSAGFEVHSCPDGPAGVGALRQGVVADMVVVDFNMPDMDGVETFERMRRIRPGIPCLFISGLGRNQVREADLANVDRIAFLRKPFDRDQLVDAVSSLFEAT